MRIPTALAASEPPDDSGSLAIGSSALCFGHSSIALGSNAFAS